jgi:hypothetical protein
MKPNYYRIEYRLRYQRKTTVIERVCSHDVTDLGSLIMISNIPGWGQPVVIPRKEIMLYSQSLIVN